MEVKTGLEINDKTLFDFSGIRIHPQNLNLKNEFKKKWGMDNYLPALVYTKQLAQILWTSYLRAENENPCLQCLEISEMTDGVRQVDEILKNLLPN